MLSGVRSSLTDAYGGRSVVDKKNRDLGFFIV